MKKKYILLVIIFVVSAFFFVYSSYHLIIWGINNQKTSKVVSHINIISKEEVKQDKTVSIDFNSLLFENKEVVGWIKVNGTSINYPVVKHSDNEYYLSHSFDQSVNDAGWIFMDSRNDADLLNFNTIIYGHGRRDGSMFGSLFQTLNQEWVDNEENLVISFTTLNHSFLFKVFSIYYIDTTDDYTAIHYDKELINKIVDRSIYSFDSNVGMNDKILTLSTCYNNDKKLVLHAKMIYEN